MTFGNSIKTCFLKYASWRGRASRSEFWWFWLLNSCTCFCLCIGIIPFYSAAIRRYHDSGHSGWWIFVPIMNLIYLVVASDEEENQYGPKPE